MVSFAFCVCLYVCFLTEESFTCTVAYSCSDGKFCFQMICFHGICHPVWHDDYRRDIKDKRPIEFDWRDARAYHLTRPKPPPSLASVATVRTSIMSGAPDIYARVAHHILTQAGRIQMLDV